MHQVVEDLVILEAVEVVVLPFQEEVVVVEVLPFLEEEVVVAVVVLLVRLVAEAEEEVGLLEVEEVEAEQVAVAFHLDSLIILQELVTL